MSGGRSRRLSGGEPETGTGGALGGEPVDPVGALRSPRAFLRERLSGRLPMTLWLVAVWVALWGDLTVANLLGGVLAALLVLLTRRCPRRGTTGRVRPGPGGALRAVFLVSWGWRRGP